jgi:hypothetical protein
MSTPAVVATCNPHVAAAAKPRHKFFLTMSATLLLLVLIGFARTLYLRAYFDVPEHPVYLLLHGGVLTAWFVWFFAQTALVAVGRSDVHRKIGMVGAGIAVAVVAAGVIATFGLVPRMIALGRDVEADLPGYAGIVWANLSLLIAFSVFVSTAIAFRRRPEIHKRLMLLASISVVGPAIARIAQFRALQVFDSASMNETIFTLAGLLSLQLTMVVYDVVTRGRIHLVTAMGVPGVFGSVLFFGLAVPITESGQSIVRLLASRAQ